MASTKTQPKAIYARPSDSAQVFGVSRATLYRWAKAGAFRIYKRGTASFVKISEVCAYIEGLGDQLGD